MRKALPVSHLREYVKSVEILVVVNAAALGLTTVELLWTWSSRSELARRDLVMINALFGLGLATSILMVLRYRRQLALQAAYK